MMSNGAKKTLSRGKFPTYFIQTKEGFYNGMLPHNLKAAVTANVCSGSSLAFSDLARILPRLIEYNTKTGKPALDYFNLLAPEEIGAKAAVSGMKSSPVTLLNPYPSLLQQPKHSPLQGYAKSHTDYLISNKYKATQHDYVNLIKLL